MSENESAPRRGLNLKPRGKRNDMQKKSSTQFPIIPQNLDAERAVLGAILLDNQALSAALDILQPTDFFLLGHGRIFAHMMKLSEEKRAIDVVILHEELERAGELEATGGSAFLSSLVDGVPRVTNVEHYCRIVKEKSILRKMAHTLDSGLRRALGGRENPDAVQAAVESSLKELSARYRNTVRAERNHLFRTGAEIAAESSSETNWIARPFVAAGSLTELGGKIKAAGKTTFVTQLVRAVLDGKPFLGQPTTKTPVVYLTEQPPASFRVAMARAGLLGRDDFVVLSWNQTLGLSWDVVVRMAVEECKRRGSRLLVVDTLAQFARLEGDSENNSGDALQAMEPLQQAAAEGLAVIVVRHERKSGGPVGDSGRGSSAYGGAVDVVLSLRRPEGKHRKTVRLLAGISRFDELPDELVIELVGGDYISLGTAADLAAREAEEAILAAVPASEDEAVTLKELLEGSNVKRTTAQRVIDDLVATGRLVKTGKGKRGDPIKYWSLKKTSAQTAPNNGRIAR